MKINLKSLLKDKNVLYIVLFLAVSNLFGYLMMNNLNAIVLFSLVGFATSYFSKNMIVVLLTAILTTNFLMASQLVGKKVKEGLENKKDKKKTDEHESDDEEKEEDKNEDKNEVEKEVNVKKPEADLDIDEHMKKLESLKPIMDNAENMLGKLESMSDKIEGLKNFMSN